MPLRETSKVLGQPQLTLLKPANLNKLQDPIKKKKLGETFVSREDIRHPNFITDEFVYTTGDRRRSVASRNGTRIDTTTGLPVPLKGRSTRRGACKSWFFRFEDTKLKPFLIYKYESSVQEWKKTRFLEQIFDSQEKVLDKIFSEEEEDGNEADEDEGPEKTDMSRE